MVPLDTWDTWLLNIFNFMKIRNQSGTTFDTNENMGSGLHRLKNIDVKAGPHIFCSDTLSSTHCCQPCKIVKINQSWLTRWPYNFGDTYVFFVLSVPNCSPGRDLSIGTYFVETRSLSHYVAWYLVPAGCIVDFVRYVPWFDVTHYP